MTEHVPNTGQSGTSAGIGKTHALMRMPGNSALPRSNRGFSRKLQDMIKKQATIAVVDNDAKAESNGPKVKFQPRNWKQLSEKELAKLSPIEKSRYLAYEPTPKEMVDKCQESLKRVRARRERDRQLRQQPPIEEVIECERNSELVGQLKSAEANHRIRLSRMQYQCNWEEELAHLISSQPTSIEAVRLKSFVPQVSDHKDLPETLNKHERIRCEKLLEDEKGLTVNRIL